MIYGLKPFNSAELRAYLDILNEAPDDGSKVTVDPTIGQKTVQDAEGTKVYDKNGNLISQSSPSVGGLQQTKNVQTGRTTTNYNMGGLDVTQSTGGGVPTVTSATTDIGPQTATVHSGVGFGGAGKDVQAPVSGSITDKATGKTTNIVGKLPTAGDMSEMTEDEDLPGTKGEWRHGGHSVKYDPDSKTVHVKGKHGEHKHTFGKHPKSDVYRSRVQQMIDKLESELTEAEKIRHLVDRIS